MWNWRFTDQRFPHIPISITLFKLWRKRLINVLLRL